MLRGRTIRETVEDGISTPDELQRSLFTAIRLEFSTIPPYLCAQWSINSDPNTPKVKGIIQGIVVQEMLHFGLACNMFTATGGSLKNQIATPDFVPTYPTTDGLPGGVHPGLVVSLLPIGNQALQTFMAIEYPDVTPVVPQPAVPPSPMPPDPPTIGQFYQAIAAGFNTVYPDGKLPSYPSPSSNQVDSNGLFAINMVSDALNAIGEITDQGEGTSTSPEQSHGTFDPNLLAHYYKFAEIYYGYTVAPVGSGFQYSGTKMTMPTFFDFAPQPPNAPEQKTFISDFTALMTQLEACWTSGASIDTDTMADLKTDGVNLIMAGFTPQFTFQSASIPQTRVDG